MSDIGFDADDWLRRANQAQQPLRPPQGILAGAMPGVVDANVGGQGQGASAGNSGAGPGLLSVLNPFSEWNYQRYLANKARGEGGQAPQAQPPPQMPAAMPQVPPLQRPPAPMPMDPNNPMPTMAGNRQTGALVQPPPQPFAPQQPPVPPPQAAPGQPQQMPAIPPASPVGRTQAAQGQGNPLDQYFQQMMALQRQRMLLGMAGGLLGAPSFGQGLGRAFTNASESIAPQSDMVSRIAGAQAAGQLTAQQPHSTKEDVQAATLQGLFGKPFEPPKFEKYEHGTFGVKPSGRMYDTTTGYSTWVHGHMGLDHSGKPVPVSQAATADLGNGHTAVLLDDHKWHDAYHPTEEGSER